MVRRCPNQTRYDIEKPYLKFDAVEILVVSVRGKKLLLETEAMLKETCITKNINKARKRILPRTIRASSFKSCQYTGHEDEENTERSNK